MLSQKELYTEMQKLDKIVNEGNFPLSDIINISEWEFPNKVAEFENHVQYRIKISLYKDQLIKPEIFEYIKFNIEYCRLNLDIEELLCNAFKHQFISDKLKITSIVVFSFNEDFNYFIYDIILNYKGEQ
jgi:hypothetical protein